jgi:hypothetical protein
MSNEQYGGTAPGTAFIFFDLNAGWNVFPSVKTVASDHILETERSLAPTIGPMDDILDST